MKEIKYVVTDPLGIHARPAGLIVKMAAGFKSAITIDNGTKKDPRLKRCGSVDFYSSVTPAALHTSNVSSSQMEDCTSPMWALPKSSIHSLDWPIPPPIVQGSLPSSSILWYVSSLRSSQPDFFSC